MAASDVLIFYNIFDKFLRIHIKRQSNHQLDLKVDPPWRNWLARLTVIRYTRLMAHQEVESSSLSGGDNISFCTRDSLDCSSSRTHDTSFCLFTDVCRETLIQRQGLIAPRCLSKCHISFAAATKNSFACNWRRYCCCTLPSDSLALAILMCISIQKSYDGELSITTCCTMLPI